MNHLHALHTANTDGHIAYITSPALSARIAKHFPKAGVYNLKTTRKAKLEVRRAIARYLRKQANSKLADIKLIVTTGNAVVVDAVKPS